MKVVVELDYLNHLADQALARLGIDKKEREIVRQVLMYAEMRGSSQGLIKIKERTILPDGGSTELKITNKTPSISRIDGGGRTGMYVMYNAALTAAKNVKATGIALVSTHNTRSSTGSIGYYANQLADEGYIAMVLAGSPKVMAIEGGIDPVFGTNPISIAIPTDEDPLILDMATAATTWFAVINARDHNQCLSPGIAYDTKGQTTISPADAMKGALKTFGGAKGSGLALMFEFLTSVLGNASMFGDDEDNRSNTIIAIDPEAVESGFKSRASDLIARLKATRPLETDNQNAVQSGIRLPGEQSTARAANCLANNQIFIDKHIYEHLLILAR